MSKNNLIKPINRRELIKYGGLALGAASLGILSNCAPSVNTSSTTTNSNDGSVGSTACGIIPSETAGPYPAHDDSGYNCLRYTGIIRSDIKSSLGSLATGGAYTGTATVTGVPLTLNLKLVNTNSNCSTGLSGYAIYIWHCDASGKYSMYNSGVTTQTFLRGVQQTDSSGNVTFQTIYPGCYSGRMPHIHFEIYPSLAQAVDDQYVVKTSQLGFTTTTSNSVYNNVSTYSASINNFANISNATDNVFSDGTTYQIANITSGNYSSGLVASLNIGLKV